jgi:KUP system potassium uptake protein
MVNSAIIGGSALLADGIPPPPFSFISSGRIRTYYPEINTIPIVIGILFV